MGSRLHALEPPWIHVVEGPWPQLADWLWKEAAGDRGAVVRDLRGRRMRAWASLFYEMAAALQFPAEFPETLSGLNDFMRDLHWLPGSRYLIAIDDAGELLREVAPEDLSMFLFLLHDVARTWARPVALGRGPAIHPRPFHVILQEQGAQVAALETHVLRAGVLVDRMPIG